MLDILTNSTEQTMNLGQELGSLLSPGDVVLLKGDLGAGKTHFAKGVALGLDITDYVTSPTFTLINEYQGRLPLYHMDFYRLDDPGEAMDLGVEEYYYGGGATLIEWPDKITGFLPDEYLAIDIRVLGEDSRKISIWSKGDRYHGLVEELKSIVHSGN